VLLLLLLLLLLLAEATSVPEEGFCCGN